MKEELAPHIEDIKRALSRDKVGDDVIEHLRSLVFDYGVPISEAKRSVIRMYGGGDSSSETSLSEHVSGDGVAGEIVARVIRISEKPSEESERTFFSGLMSLRGKEVFFTSLCDFGLAPGAVVRIKGAVERELHGRPELILDEQCEVVMLDADVADHSDISPLSGVRISDANVSVVCRVLETGPKTISTREGNKIIFTGVLADGTGKLPFTSWVDLSHVSEGDVLRLENAYVRSWKGMPNLNIGEHTTVAESDAEMPSASELEPPIEMRISEATSRVGLFDVLVEGDIVSIKSGSGLIMRCPKCNRVVQANECITHGVIEPVADMRIKAAVDDGTDVLTVILDRELAAQLYDHSLSDLMDVAAQIPLDKIEDDLRMHLTGVPLRVRGNVSRAKHGSMMVAEEIYPVDEDISAQVDRFLEDRKV